jgi:hypothetical protein
MILRGHLGKPPIGLVYKAHVSFVIDAGIKGNDLKFRSRFLRFQAQRQPKDKNAKGKEVESFHGCELFS